MLIESGNPVHSLADSHRMREALRALDLVVVIDVALTETAREADYVLPAASQYEKWECTFFNLEFPHNVYHLRRPIFEPLAGTLPEYEIHSRLCRALGAYTDADLAPLRDAAAEPAVPRSPRRSSGSPSNNPGSPSWLPCCSTRSLGPDAGHRRRRAGRRCRGGVGSGATMRARLCRLDPAGRVSAARQAAASVMRCSMRSSLRRTASRSPSTSTTRRCAGWRPPTRRSRWPYPPCSTSSTRWRPSVVPSRRRLSVRARRGRAPLVDGQHHPTRSGVAQEGRAGRVAGLGRRRSTDRAEPMATGRGSPPSAAARLPSSRSPTRCCRVTSRSPTGSGSARVGPAMRSGWRRTN